MKIDDASLLAYVDGELTPQENARIEEAIAASEELASRVATLRASQLPYGEAFDQQSLPPVPESLTRSVRRTDSPPPGRRGRVGRGTAGDGRRRERR
ncbi:anti-sigma factor family protein [Burkholderia gladioli]